MHSSLCVYCTGVTVIIDQVIDEGSFAFAWTEQRAKG